MYTDYKKYLSKSWEDSSIFLGKVCQPMQDYAELLLDKLSATWLSNYHELNASETYGSNRILIIP